MRNINADTQLGAPTGQFLFQLPSLLFQACALPEALLKLLLSLLQDSSGLKGYKVLNSLWKWYMLWCQQPDDMGYVDHTEVWVIQCIVPKAASQFSCMFSLYAEEYSYMSCTWSMHMVRKGKVSIL